MGGIRLASLDGRLGLSKDMDTKCKRLHGRKINVIF